MFKKPTEEYKDYAYWNEVKETIHDKMHIRREQFFLKNQESGILFDVYREIHCWKEYDHRVKETVKIKRDRKYRFILKESE